MNSNKIENFKLEHSEIWVNFLDGNPVRGFRRGGFDSQRSASTSMSLTLDKYAKDYGFKNGAEMRKKLVESGRLETRKL